MSVLLYFRYFIDSVRQRGLIATLQIPFYEWKYERFFNIHTKGILKSNSPIYFHYQGVTYYALFKLKKLLQKYAHSHAFYDIGCGKGRALIAADYFGFKAIYGIELDASLSKQAEINWQRYSKQKTDTHLKIITGNAAEADYPDFPCVFFMFNPFHSEVLSKVLENIKKGAENRHVFVYVNPKHKEVFEQMGFIKREEIKTNKFTEAVVYTHL